MEQNELMENDLTNIDEVDNLAEVSLVQESGTQKGELTEEKTDAVEMENSGEVAPKSDEDSPTTPVSAVKEEELYQKLKTGLMEEIRKYFDPILKESKIAQEVLLHDDALPVEREDNLINRIIDESGW